MISINSLRLASWKIFQPLVAVPSVRDSVVSDLFIWRKSRTFKTCFELTSIPSLFDENTNYDRSVVIFFFDSEGNKISEHNLSIEPHTRRTLDLCSILPDGCGSHGSFSVFHSHIPDFVRSSDSFVSERGYVGYSYKSSDVVSYAHGNFDAIAYSNNSYLQMLGRQSFRHRAYHLQYILNPQFRYDIIIVNPTNSQQPICCDVLSLSGQLMHTLKASLNARASHCFRISPELDNFKVVLRSRLVMARPLVFRLSESSLDVFHG